MRILVLAGPQMAEEFRQKFPDTGDGIHYSFLQSHNITDEQLEPSDVVFDFLLHEQPERLSMYAPEQVVFCNAATIQLAALVKESGVEKPCTLIGFNGLPSLFNRPVLEVSLYNKRSESKLIEICNELETEFLVVKDRVGMVTPRIICMIINEACYTLQERTASKEDIDLGMKLGTNYPKGPFEWANLIGIDNVYNVLQAVYNDTKEERYKVCPLLKTKFLKGEKFEL
ncbi:3-hydroxyacyl-CoA dehydrogenase family protein [Pontibacter burrus]|uniref:3-hydroxyacyl-CoA dehydrogenase n=1 Tax=Pontibacter burrus TaxID=2704466 RepID=A0A6B3LMM0_9BACT|nr:3-hydroxyacyl-CoA dehydrogenase family protein [Pontibacter burrus]NEM96315.1 3-hydroxyacyl-CoA dehydrogenase [Pontibacter burrus]